MRTYVVTTGVVFGLIAVVHLWRVVEEGSQLAKEPFFIVVTALAASLAIWAWRLASRPAH
jgi:hypothetical protein